MDFAEKKTNYFMAKGLKEEDKPDRGDERELDPIEQARKEMTGAPRLFDHSPQEIVDAEIEANPNKYLSKRGTLGLDPYLDQVRLERRIPDIYFKTQLAFDRIMVVQLDYGDGNTYEGTMIEKAPGAKKRDAHECPRGILVGAGLRALDALRSNGIDLGHVVNIIELAPFRMKVGTILGHEVHALLLRDGDLTGSETLREQLKSGEVKIHYSLSDGVVEHTFVDKEGKHWKPQMPWVPDDY